MKIPCAKCGAQNELGRVFCTSCGQKLDLSQRTAVQDIEEDAGPGIVKHIVVAVIVVLVLTALVLAAMALWPAKPIIDNTGEKRGAARVAQLLVEAKRAVAMSGAGERRSLQLSEKEINTYLERKCEGLGFTSITVNMLPDSFVLRIEAPGLSLPFTLPGMTSGQLPITYMVRGGFVSGQPAQPVFSSVRMGHLPLIRALRSSFFAKLAAIFDDFLKEQDLVDTLQEVALDDDKVVLIFQK